MEQNSEPTSEKPNLPPLSQLPFTYTEVSDPEQADIVIRKFEIQEDLTPLMKAHERKEQQEWFTSSYWRKKGRPLEQFTTTIGDQSISTYNFDQTHPLFDEHITDINQVLSRAFSLFPQLQQYLSWILIDNNQHYNRTGEPALGKTYKKNKMFCYYPAGMDLQTYRIPGMTTFAGVPAHELGHLIQESFLNEWRKEFPWHDCEDNEDWIYDEEIDHYRNKVTGKSVFKSWYPIKANECVSDYAAAIEEDEDFAESFAAYINNPQYLQNVSPKKFAILDNTANKKIACLTSTTAVTSDKISLPEIKPETVRFCVIP